MVRAVGSESGGSGFESQAGLIVVSYEDYQIVNSRGLLRTKEVEILHTELDVNDLDGRSVSILVFYASELTKEIQNTSGKGSTHLPSEEKIERERGAGNGVINLAREEVKETISQTVVNQSQVGILEGRQGTRSETSRNFGGQKENSKGRNASAKITRRHLRRNCTQRRRKEHE
ncbi:hypothetical protein Bbelb_148880 [Branchiostoma belcheri]|nr:hypothetical protein Bbelb_148880 [Branchiostoma belcheri]